MDVSNSNSSSCSSNLYDLHRLEDLYRSSSSSNFFDSSDGSSVSSKDTCSSLGVSRKKRSSKTTYTNEDRYNSLFYKLYIKKANIPEEELPI